MVLQGKASGWSKVEDAGCVKGHLQEGEREPVRMFGGSGWPGTLQDEVFTSGWCEQDAIVQDEQVARLQEKLSWMSREH